MTLTDRNALIDSVTHSLEASHKDFNELAEHACCLLASDYGIVVTPDEITRVLSALAEPVTQP